MNFIDVMDPTRVVCPIQNQDSKKNSVVCRVFWQSSKGLVFSGTTEIPKRLFLNGDEPEYQQVARVGFLPEPKATERAAREAAKAKPRSKDRRRSRDEDFEDEE